LCIIVAASRSVVFAVALRTVIHVAAGTAVLRPIVFGNTLIAAARIIVASVPSAIIVRRRRLALIAGFVARVARVSIAIVGRHLFFTVTIVGRHLSVATFTGRRLGITAVGWVFLTTAVVRWRFLAAAVVGWGLSTTPLIWRHLFTATFIRGDILATLIFRRRVFITIVGRYLFTATVVRWRFFTAAIVGWGLVIAAVIGRCRFTAAIVRRRWLSSTVFYCTVVHIAIISSTVIRRTIVGTLLRRGAALVLGGVGRAVLGRLGIPRISWGAVVWRDGVVSIAGRLPCFAVGGVRIVVRPGRVRVWSWVRAGCLRPTFGVLGCFALFDALEHPVVVFRLRLRLGLADDQRHVLAFEPGLEGYTSVRVLDLQRAPG